MRFLEVSPKEMVEPDLMNSEGCVPFNRWLLGIIYYGIHWGKLHQQPLCNSRVNDLFVCVLKSLNVWALMMMVSFFVRPSESVCILLLLLEKKKMDVFFLAWNMCDNKRIRWLCSWNYHCFSLPASLTKRKVPIVKMQYMVCRIARQVYIYYEIK